MKQKIIKRNIKNAIYEQLARSTKALGHPKRIEILDLLSQVEKTVEQISQQAEMGIKNASAQLKELRSALLVDSRKDGKHIYYRLSNPQTNQLLHSIRKYSEQQFSELQKIATEAFASVDELESVDRKQLLSKARRGEVILLDVRPVEEFDQAHLPFAHSVPISELSQKMKTLPKSKEIIAYCRGPYCFFAKEAVETLRKKGFKAHRLKDSIADWESKGLSVIRRRGA